MINERTLFKFIYSFGILIPSRAVDLTYIVLTDLCPSLLPTFFSLPFFFNAVTQRPPPRPNNHIPYFSYQPALSGKLFS